MADLAKEVQREYERLKGLFSDREEKLPLADELLRKCAFLTAELRRLEKSIGGQGLVQVSNKGATRTNPALKAYLSMLGVYQGIVRTLTAILGDEAKDGDDALDEFMRRVEER